MTKQETDANLSLLQKQHNFEHSWEPAIAERIAFDLQKHDDPHTPYMICLVGIPGGGKSVSSLLLANLLDEQHGIGSMIMPHDGYHYPLEQLKLFPNPDDVIYRRGAPDTFDPHALLRDLERIRNGHAKHDTTSKKQKQDDHDHDHDHDDNDNGNGNGNDDYQQQEDLILVPGFDHGKGDPEPDAHAFDRNRHKVVICEGLYLLHQGDGWEEIANMFDFKIFIQSNVDNCVERLKIRNLCIPGYTPEEIQIRCEKVDRVNAMTVMNSKSRADLIVDSMVAKQQPKAIAKAMSRHSRVDSMDALNLMISNEQENQVDPPGIKETVKITDAPEPSPWLPQMMVGTWEKAMVEKIREQMRMVAVLQQQEEQHNPAAISQRSKPFMVGLVGMPGSGKSVSSLLLATELEQNGTECMIMPHDGYHYTLDYLKTLSNAEDFIYRRGAPDTFDPVSLLRDLDRIANGTEDIVFVPGFDHAHGDPEPDKHIFDRSKHRVVLCEGLYLLHNDDGWEPVADHLDVTIFMNSSVDVCVERVKIRNQCIPGYTAEEIVKRAEKVDRVNAMTVLKSKARATVIVDSMAVKK